MRREKRRVVTRDGMLVCGLLLKRSRLHGAC